MSLLKQQLEFAKSIPPYTQPIPFERDSRGNSIPRSAAYWPPLIGLDNEALIEYTEKLAECPEDGQKFLPNLYALNVAADRIRLDSGYRREKEERQLSNEKLEADIQVLNAELDLARKAERDAAIAAAASCASLGLTFREDRRSFEFDEHEPISLECIAGRESLPPPERDEPSAFRSHPYLTAALGPAFGLGLGLFTRSISMDARFAEQWFAVIGWALLGIVAFLLHGFLRYVTRSVGTRLFALEVRSFKGAAGIFALMSLLAVVWSVGAISIESHVERAGLGLVLAEEGSLQPPNASPDLFWAGLAITLPIIASSFMLGILDGLRTANLCRLKWHQEAERARIRSMAAFPMAVQDQANFQLCRERSISISEGIKHLESRIQTGPSQEQLRIHEDWEIQHAACNQECKWSIALLGVRFAEHVSHVHAVGPKPRSLLRIVVLVAAALVLAYLAGGGGR